MSESQFKNHLTIALGQKTYEQIKEIADDLNISMAEWIRRVLEKELIKEGDNLNAIIRREEKKKRFALEIKQDKLIEH